MNTPYIVSITSVSCRDLVNVEMASIGWSGLQEGKNDPYVKLQFGPWSDKTEYINDAGADADWPELSFRFKTTAASIRVHEMKIEVYDWNTLKHTFIGAAKLSLQTVADSRTEKERDMVVEIMDTKGAKTGDVILHVKLEIDVEAVEAKQRADRMAMEAEQEAIDFLMKDSKVFEGFIVIRQITCEELANVEMIEKNSPFVELKFAQHNPIATTPNFGAGSNTRWEDLYIKFDAGETSMRMDFLDVNVNYHKESGVHHFVGDASVLLIELLENVGKRIEKSIDIKNAKNRRSGRVKLLMSAHRFDAEKAATLAEPKVKYVMEDEIVKHVPNERIILPRYKIQITDKFIESIRKMLTAQNTYTMPRVEAYGLVTKILSATDDGNIEIREEAQIKKPGAKGKVDRVIEAGHSRSIRRLSIWQGDGITYILSASSDGTVRIFDFDSSEYLRTLKGHDGPVLTVGAAPEGELKKALAVTGGNDCTVRVYSMMSGRERLCLRGHSRKVVAVCCSDPKYTVGGIYVIVSMDHLGEIRLWEKEKGNILRVLNAQTPVTIHELPDYEHGGH